MEGLIFIKELIMKTKTIQKIIKAQIDDFISYIDDESIKNIFKEQTIVTGGCITSMLLGEDVNDFDIYLRTKEAAFKVAEYFLEKEATGSELVLGGGITTIKSVEEKLGSTVADSDSFFLKMIEDKDRVRIYIPSSGVINCSNNSPEPGESINQEVFVKNNTDKDTKYKTEYITSNAITLRNKIQIIIRFTGEPNEIHKNYDYEHCKNYWTSWDNKLITNVKSLECILAKQLFYTGSKYPLCSIFRSKKFIQRGWSINAGQYLKMAMQLNEIDLCDVETLEDQLVGVDSAYFMEIIRHLRDKKIKRVDNEYITTIINKVFE